MPAAPANTCLKNFRLRRKLTSQCRCQRDKKFSACGAQTCLQREKNFPSAAQTCLQREKNFPPAAQTCLQREKKFPPAAQTCLQRNFFFSSCPCVPLPPPPRALTSGGKEVTSSPDPVSLLPRYRRHTSSTSTGTCGQGAPITLRRGFKLHERTSHGVTHGFSMLHSIECFIEYELFNDRKL